METKEELRAFFLNYRSNLDLEKRESASLLIQQKFFRLKAVKAAARILAYCSHRNEIKTDSIIKQLLLEGKRVYLPYCMKDTNELRLSPIENFEEDLETGAYGIKEPRKKMDSPVLLLDLVIVPGVAFARDGHRLGYGGGYYDRFLSRLSRGVWTVGLTYHYLLVDRLPIDRYDRAVDIIITDQEVIHVGR